MPRGALDELGRLVLSEQSRVSVLEPLAGLTRPVVLATAMEVSLTGAAVDRRCGPRSRGSRRSPGTPGHRWARTPHDEHQDVHRSAAVLSPRPRGRLLLTAAGRGALAGLAGVAAMTAAEQVEQGRTGRRDSYVPGRTLLALLGRRPAADAKPLLVNHVMHWGTGAVVGALRGVWSVVGLRGPRASLAHTVVRLAFDQSLENGTGMGAPPHTWPPLEQVVDVVGKAAYAFVTGVVADAWIDPDLQSRAGRTSH